MLSRLSWLLIACVLIIPCTVVLAQSSSGPGSTATVPHWWEIITGVLAIPTAMLGIVSSWILIKNSRVTAQKTQAEIQQIAVTVEKTQLEIREKQKILGEAASERASQATREVIEPLERKTAISHLVARFILLYIIMNLWGLVQFVVYEPVQTFLSLVAYSGGGILGSLMSLVRFLLDAIHWMLFAYLGIPVLREATTVLGMDVKSIFRFNSRKHKV